MQRLAVSGAVRPIYVSLGVKWLIPLTTKELNRTKTRMEFKAGGSVTKQGKGPWWHSV
jgi:hypothetical protein